MIYIYLFISEYTHKYRHGESISGPIKIIQTLFLSLVLVLTVACGGGGGGGLVNSGMIYTVVPAVESTYTLTVTGPTGIKVSQKIKIFISP